MRLRRDSATVAAEWWPYASCYVADTMTALPPPDARPILIAGLFANATASLVWLVIASVYGAWPFAAWSVLHALTAALLVWVVL